MVTRANGAIPFQGSGAERLLAVTLQLMDGRNWSCSVNSCTAHLQLSSHTFSYCPYCTRLLTN